MRTNTILRWLPLFLVAGALGGCVFVTDDDASLSIHNRSDFVLTEVRITEVDNPNWGPNLLRDVLYPGEDLVIVDIDCGYYDALVVDETGTECELDDLDLCFDDQGWVITNTTLALCAF